MSHWLEPKSKSQATKVSQVLRAWACDLKHVVDGLNAAADEYASGTGDQAKARTLVEGATSLFRTVLSSMITKRLA